MHKILVATALAGSMLLAPALAAPARAEHVDFFVGGGFRIGPVHFDIALGNRGSRHHGHHYYRTRHRLHYPSQRCSNACFKERGTYYHDPYCPVVLRHFDRYRANPYDYWDRYAPRRGADRRGYDGYRDPGYDGYRGDRYGDHRGNGRGHGRYDDHGDRRDRRHHRGHHRGHSCPYRH